MKPVPFDYVRPHSIERGVRGARTRRQRHHRRRPDADPDARHAARAPGVNRRHRAHSRPRRHSRRGGRVVIGATTRQVEAERSALIARCVPLLAMALPFVGHAPTRNRGTVGGSVANADPAAEIPLVLVTLAGAVVVRDAARTQRDRGARFLSRSHDDGAAERGGRHRTAVSGLDRRPRSASASTRSRRGRAISPSRPPPPRCRSTDPAAARMRYWHRRRDAGAGAARCSGGRLIGSTLTDGEIRDAAVTDAIERTRDHDRHPRLAGLPQARRQDAGAARARAMPGMRHCERTERRMKVDLQVNGSAGERRGRAAHDIARLPARSSRPRPARTPAASTAFAAPARCCSTASRCARA